MEPTVTDMMMCLQFFSREKTCAAALDLQYLSGSKGNVVSLVDDHRWNDEAFMCLSDPTKKLTNATATHHCYRHRKAMGCEKGSYMRSTKEDQQVDDALLRWLYMFLSVRWNDEAFLCIMFVANSVRFAGYCRLVNRHLCTVKGNVVMILVQFSVVIRCLDVGVVARSCEFG
ncbi:hypothetical protein Tco_0839036 [Tanacetum coccineum]|uniref:Uncharacterized protein n=1 Tax=Tanacetum coccineum TaxID=301880 RepID=A0ABQ5ATZ4_9ASTR